MPCGYAAARRAKLFVSRNVQRIRTKANPLNISLLYKLDSTGRAQGPPLGGATSLVGSDPQIAPWIIAQVSRRHLGKRDLPAAGGRGREGSVSVAAPLAGRRVSRPGKGIRGKAACLPTFRYPIFIMETAARAIPLDIYERACCKMWFFA